MRPISVASLPTPAPTISGKLPSAFAKYESSSSSAAATPVIETKEPVKKGRPSKEEMRRHKMDMASEAIAALCSDKPTRAAVRTYMESRIKELDEEKR